MLAATTPFILSWCPAKGRSYHERPLETQISAVWSVFDVRSMGTCRQEFSYFSDIKRRLLSA